MQTTPVDHTAQLPSPLTHQASTATESFREATATPEDESSQVYPASPPGQFSSPPVDTQPFSQFVLPAESLSQNVVDEEAESVWGYLIPLDRSFGDTLVMRTRTACPAPYPENGFGAGSKKRSKGLSDSGTFKKEEEKYEETKTKKGFPGGGYLIGRHPECGKCYCIPFHF